MAEARQAVAFQFAVTEKGIQVHFDKDAVKSALRSLLSFGKSRYLRSRNALLKGIFPASPLSLMCIVVLVACVRVGGWDPSLGPVKLVRWLGFQGMVIIVGVYLFEALCLWVVLSYLQRFTLKVLLCYKGWMFDPHGKQSYQTKVWAMTVKTLTMFTKPQLHSYQSTLPRLPVPPLKDTCRRYLESVRPLLDDDSFREMESLVKDFQNGVGRTFQRYLVLKSWWATNYVTDWWESYVYLHGRSSLMINSNYYACDVNKTLTSNPVARAGALAYIMMRLKRDIERGVISPLLIMGVIPLCSSQYHRLFGTTRRAGITSDTLLHYSGTESDYCVCCCDGRWFKVPLTTPQGKIYTPSEMEYQFQMVIDAKDKEVNSGEEHLPALTTLKRNKWAEIREKYFLGGVNQVSMEIIEKAAYLMIFDPKTPSPRVEDGDCSNLTTYCKDLLHGNGHSCWFDKSVTLVMYANGRLGINAEHSWADAPIVGYALEYSCNLEAKFGYQDDGHCHGYADVQTPPPHPQQLEWKFPQECVDEIESAHSLALEQINDLDMYVLRHDDFGKGVMKKCKISPDAFIQMALQMAFYKNVGKLCLTYEASMTRLYLEGRTETVRAVTTKSAQFVKAMCDPCDPNMDKETIRMERKRLLVEATDHHACSYKMAMTGKGIDRHLFCLYVMSKYLKMESPFLGKVLNEPWRLSTSQTPSQQTGKVDYDSNPDKISGGGGFGPVAKDGYGVSYIIQGDNTIFFHVSAFNSSPDTNAQRFAELIKESLREMIHIFQLS